MLFFLSPFKNLMQRMTVEEKTFPITFALLLFRVTQNFTAPKHKHMTIKSGYFFSARKPVSLGKDTTLHVDGIPY
jgi:hypothetical protein